VELDFWLVSVNVNGYRLNKVLLLVWEYLLPKFLELGFVSTLKLLYSADVYTYSSSVWLFAMIFGSLGFLLLSASSG
jgi:hypothetical protein